MGRALILQNLTNKDKEELGSITQKDAFTVVLGDDADKDFAETMVESSNCENMDIQDLRFIIVKDANKFAELREYVTQQAMLAANMPHPAVE